jgi:hypothetical protein
MWSGRFEQLAGLKGHFHFAEKKGYSGVAVYTRHEPSDVVIGYGSASSTPRAAMWSCALTRRKRKLILISAYFPSGSSGEERQQAKFRFLAEFEPAPGGKLKKKREFILCGDVNIAHQEIDLKNWRSNQKNSGFLPEERAWMTALLTRPAWWTCTASCSRHHRHRLHLVEQPRPGLCQQRGLAAGLPPGHAGSRPWRAPKRSTRPRSSPTTRRSRSSTTSRCRRRSEHRVVAALGGGFAAQQRGVVVKQRLAAGARAWLRRRSGRWPGPAPASIRWRSSGRCAPARPWPASGGTTCPSVPSTPMMPSSSATGTCLKRGGGPAARTALALLARRDGRARAADGQDAVVARGSSGSRPGSRPGRRR